MSPRFTWTLENYRARLAADPLGYPPDFYTWPPADRDRCLKDCSRFAETVITDSDHSFGYFPALETEAPRPLNSGNGHGGYEAPGAHEPPKAILVGLDEIEPEPISWVWKYFIALGKFHIIAGAPGDGKTTIILSFIAAISSGGMFPDGTRARVGNCIIWTNEDGVADTIKPRLIRMGADMKRIKIVRGHRDKNGKVRPFNPATDMPSLTEAAKELDGGVTLLMLDPVVSAVPAGRNSGDKNAETRAGLAPVVAFAEALNAAAFGISHVSKGTAGREPLERVTGSLIYGAVPRIVYLTAKNKAVGDNECERILTRAKSNIGQDGGLVSILTPARCSNAPILRRRPLFGSTPLKEPRPKL